MRIEPRESLGIVRNRLASVDSGGRMSQVKITCPRCKEKFVADEAALYECPFCGTNVRPKHEEKDEENMEKTQQFKI